MHRKVMGYTQKRSRTMYTKRSRAINVYNKKVNDNIQVKRNVQKRSRTINRKGQWAIDRRGQEQLVQKRSMVMYRKGQWQRT